MSASKFSKATVCFVCFTFIFAVALITAFSCGIIEIPAFSSEISAEAATGAATTDVLQDGEVASGYSPSGTGISNIDTARQSPSGKYYLTQDITIESLHTGNYRQVFTGTLDGCGHTITINAEATSVDCADAGGLFIGVNGGTIKNVKIVVDKFRYGSTAGSAQAGIIAAYAINATVDNVYIELNYKPTVATPSNNTAANVDIYAYAAKQVNGFIVRLGGVFGKVESGTTNIKNTTVYNAATGNYGFSGGTWTGSNTWSDMYIGGFVGSIESGGTLNATNIVYAGNQGAKITCNAENIINGRTNKGFIGAVVGYNNEGPTNISGFIFDQASVVLGTDFKVTNCTKGIGDRKGLILGNPDSGYAGTWEKLYLNDSNGTDWLDGSSQTRGAVTKFPSAYSPRFVGTGEIAFNISTKQAPDNATKIVKTVTYSGSSYNVMESNIARTSEEVGQTSWFTLDTVNAGGKDTMPSITITAYATQSTISMTSDLTITSDSDAYRAEREYNGSNVTAPKISLGDGRTGLNYSESNANKNVGTHTLTTNIDSSDYKSVDYEGTKYVYHTGNGVIYIPQATSAGDTSAGDTYDIAKPYIVEVTTRNVTIGNGSATITYGDTAEAVKTNNAPTCTSGSLVAGERISAYNVSDYTQCAKNAGIVQSFTYSGVVILDGSDTDVSGNYNITYGDVSAKVAKKTISGNLTLNDSVFSGAEKEATFNITSGEFYNGDSVAISYSGDRINVTDEGFTATATLPKFDGTNSNYMFDDGSDTVSATLHITPMPVPISVNTSVPKSYEFSGVWTNSRLAELFVSPTDIHGETLLLAFKITHNSAPATAVRYIGEYNIAATLLESYTNYTAVEVETTLNITAKEITVSAMTEKGKTYDGQAVTDEELQKLFTVQGAVAEGNYPGLIVHYDETEVKNAGEYRITVSMPDDYNKMYVLVGRLPSTTYTILPKEIAVNWGETSFEYDGTEKKPAPTADTGIEGESVTIEVTVQGGSAVNVGTYNATASQSNTNYTLTNTTSVFDITAAALKDLAVSLEDWTYGGTASVPSVTGNTGGGAETVTYSGTAYDGTVFTDSATAPDRAGEYTVKVSVAASGNYAADSAQSTFEILRATLTDNTVAVKVTYDGAAHGLTIALTGFVKGDSFDTASGKVISYGTEEGNYSSELVTVTNVIDSKTVYYKAEFHNYVTVESSRSVTVNPLTVAIEWCENKFTYNGSVQIITATYADVLGSNIPLNVTTDDREFKNAGNYTATAAFANDETNYALPATVTAAYNIAKLAVSVQAQSVSEQYGESVNSLGWQYLGEARFFETVDFEVTTNATATSPVGTYPTVVTPQSFDNYDVTYSDGVLTVTKRIVTLNIVAKRSQYGDPIATLTAALQEGSSFAGTDTAETVYKLSTIATNMSAVGNYDINGEGINDNYTLFFNNGKSAYEIVKRKVTLNIQPATSVFGDPIAPLSATEASGTLLEGDDNVYSLSAAATSSSAVGGYDITGKIENSNYDITFDGGAGAYKITARVVTINWCKNNFTYNGSVQTITATYKDIADSAVALSVTTDREFKNAGNYTATAAFANDETNYALPATVTAAYEMKKAASVINILGVATVYTYTGEKQTVTGATLNHGETELVYSDNTFTTVAEGNGKTVTITAAESANYFGASETVTITVNKLKVDKPSVSVTEFVYDNTEKTLISDISDGERYTVAEGKATKAGKYTATVSLKDTDNTEWSDGGADPFDIEWEILKADYDMTDVSFSDKTFEYDGQSHTVTVEGVLPTGRDGIQLTVTYSGGTVTDVKDGSVTVTATFATVSTNYNAPAPMNAYISVYAKTVAIEWCANDFTYNGTAQTIAATYADVSGSAIALKVTTDREFKNAGDYTATAAFAKGETNYALPADKSKAYSIRKLEVSVVADDAKMEYGDTPADLTWSYAKGSAEFVETDGITLTVITDADSESAAGGNYYTHIVEVTLENYIVNYQDGVFSVAPRKITVTIDKKSSVYGDEIAELTSSVTSGNIVNDDTEVYSLSTAAKSSSAVGGYDITGKIENSNYDITFEGETNAYTIGKRAVTVTIYGATSVYGDEIAELTSSVTEGEIVNGDTEVYSLSTSATNSSNVGEYNINGTVNNLNYDITFEGGTYAYTITARKIAIVWCENNFTYDGGVQAVIAYYKDINNAEVALAVTVKEADGAEAEFKNAGDYTATAAFGNGETNYALPATVTAAYNIAKLAVSVVANDAKMYYGDTPAGLGWSYAEGSAQFVASDNIELIVSATADNSSSVGEYVTAITESVFDNYAITYAKGVMRVVARELTVTIDEKSSVYGDEIAKLTSSVTAGNIVNDDGNVYSLSTAATSSSAVGGYDITGKIENSNYDITFVGGADAYTITAREIAIVWCENNFTYNGSVQAITATYKDINNSEVALDIIVKADDTVAEFKNAGDYTAEAVFKNGETNYALPEIVTKGYSIGKLAVSVIADDTEMEYGDTPADLTWSYAKGSAEFVASDNVIVEVITDATSASPVGGIYYTRIDTIVDDNYSVSYVDGVMSVIKATPVVKVNVVIPENGLFTSSAMPDIEWTASSFGAEVSGVVEWVESALVAGTNEYNWIFTPQDTDNFNPVTEKYKLTVEEVMLASISPDFILGENKIYASDTLETLKQYLTVTGKNNDGSSVGVITEYELEGIIKSGICTITVRVGEVTATFDVTVEQVEVTGIRISVAPDKTEYVAFESFDASGMVVTAVYANGSSKVITDYTVEGGENLLTSVTYVTVKLVDGGAEFEATVNITVKKRRVSVPVAVTGLVYNGAEQTGVSAGEYYTVTNGKGINAGYYTATVSLVDDVNTCWDDENASVEDKQIDWSIAKAIPSASVTVKPTEGLFTSSDMPNISVETSSVPGTAAWVNTELVAGINAYEWKFTPDDTVNFEEIFGDYTLTVSAVELVSIAVTADPNKTDYEYGDSFDNTGMEVTAYYNDGNSATVTDYVVGADIIKIIGEVTITVEYGGMSAVTTINVAQRRLSVIDIVAVDRAYDGTTVVEVRGRLDSVVEGDDVAVVLYGSIDDKNVGADKTVYVKGELVGADAGNYVLSEPANATVTVYAREVEVVWSGLEITYNGESQSPSAAAETGVEGEALTLAVYGEGTTVGRYDATAVIEPADSNYALIGAETAFEIVRADGVIDISGVRTVYTYTGEEQTVTGAVLNHGETELVYSLNTFVTVAEGNGMVVTVSAAETENYLAVSVNIVITVNKADYDMSGVIFEDVEFVYDGTEKILTLGGELPDGVTYALSENTRTEAGAIEVTATFSGDAENYNAIPDMTATLTVAKATYDMSEIIFEDATFVKDGTVRSIEISGALPDGVSVEYIGNGQSEDGVYVVTAVFTGDVNYNDIAPMTAIITINSIQVTHTDDDTAITVVVIDAPEGVHPETALVVTPARASYFEEAIGSDERVTAAYEISLLKDGEAVATEGMLTVRLLKPATASENIRLVAFDGVKVTEIEYEIDGDYVVFETDQLAEYAFIVNDQPSYTLLFIVLLAVLFLAEVLFIIWKRAKMRRDKKSPFAAAGAFLTFVAQNEITLLAVLGVAVALLGIYIIYLYIPKKKKNEESEDENPTSDGSKRAKRDPRSDKRRA